MTKKEWKQRAKDAETRLDIWQAHRWVELPEEERERYITGWIRRRATQRAAMSPFRLTFEDEVNNAGVDMYRDYHRTLYGEPVPPIKWERGRGLDG